MYPRLPDFKPHLAQSSANGTPMLTRNVDEDDSVEAHTGKIFDRHGQSRPCSSVVDEWVNRAVDLPDPCKKSPFWSWFLRRSRA